MGKDNTIKITEEEALELLRERLCHLRERTDFLTRSSKAWVDTPSLPQTLTVTS